jgi:hypothetical protein
MIDSNQVLGPIKQVKQSSMNWIQHELINWTHGENIIIPRIEIIATANEKQELYQLVDEIEVWLRPRLSTCHIEGGLSKPGVWAIHFHGPVIQHQSDHDDAILKILIMSIKSLLFDQN